MAVHVEQYRRLDIDCETVARVKSEIQASLGAEIIPVTAVRLVDKVMSPACSGLGLDGERSYLALITPEKVEQIDLP